MSPDSVQIATKSLRVREAILIAAVILFPVSILLAGIPLMLVMKTYAPLWIMVAVYVPLIVLLAVWHQRFRCPRCAEFFFSRAGAQKPLSRVCLHCGLELLR